MFNVQIIATILGATALRDNPNRVSVNVNPRENNADLLRSAGKMTETPVPFYVEMDRKLYESSGLNMGVVAQFTGRALRYNLEGSGEFGPWAREKTRIDVTACKVVA